MTGAAAPGLRLVRGLALACHPGPSLAVTGLAALLAVGADAPPRTTLLVALAVLVGQLSVGWANDWLDADRDAAAARVDKPVAAGQIGRTTVRSAAFAALVAVVPTSLALGPRAALAHVVFVASAWAYDLGVKATVWSWAPYALSFGLLPDVVTLALPGHPFAPWWLVGAGSLLGVGAHLVNVLPDLDDDRATGVRGLPHRLGRKASSLGAAVVLVVAAALPAVGPDDAPPTWAWSALAVAAVAAVVAAVTGSSGAHRLVPLVATTVVAACAVALLVGSGASLG